MDATARALLKHGIPFRTVISRPTRSRQNGLPHPIANPLLEVMNAVRSTPHEFYSNYEHLRDDVLQTRVGRSALLRGGILWRLSIDTVPIEAVLEGPTFANELVASTAINAYFDDALSQTVTELIVGAFHFEGANRGLRSYWPRYETFHGSGLDGGQWLPDAERWYNNHLEGLRCGGQPLKSSRIWTADLKRNVKACRPIIQASEALSAQFISTNMVGHLTLVHMSLILTRTFSELPAIPSMHGIRYVPYMLHTLDYSVPSFAYIPGLFLYVH